MIVIALLPLVNSQRWNASRSRYRSSSFMFLPLASVTLIGIQRLPPQAIRPNVRRLEVVDAAVHLEGNDGHDAFAHPLSAIMPRQAIAVRTSAIFKASAPPRPCSAFPAAAVESTRETTF